MQLGHTLAEEAPLAASGLNLFAVLSVGTVRDWVQARVVPDRPAQVLLRVIEAEPETVRRVLEGGEAALAS